MLKVELAGFDVALLTVDQGCENVSLHHREVLADAVIELLQGISRIVGEPLCLSEHDLSLGQSLVLFGYVFQKLECPGQVLGHAHGWLDGFVSAVNQVLLSQLHEEIRTQFDVEVDVAVAVLGLCDVKVQRLIQQLDCLFLLAFLSPGDDGFKVDLLRCLLLAL